jgi:hypothetical protein
LYRYQSSLSASRHEFISLKYSHALVIGATGMLQAAAIKVARRSNYFSAVARSVDSLQRLERRLANIKGGRSLLPLDWNDADSFLSTLAEHADVIGSPTLVVAWVHEPLLGVRIANLFSSAHHPCEFFHILGSAVAAPGSDSAWLRGQIRNEGALAYRQIVLGYCRNSSNSRWLTDEEISAGVLDAVQQKTACHIVGQIAPWSERPQWG